MKRITYSVVTFGQHGRVLPYVHLEMSKPLFILNDKKENVMPYSKLWFGPPLKKWYGKDFDY